MHWEGQRSESGVIGNLADLGAVLLRLDDGPLRKQAPYGHRQLPILPDNAPEETRLHYRLISVIWRFADKSAKWMRKRCGVRGGSVVRPSGL
jgi:hypothetical protein